jgi:hypothetical protein
MKPHPKISLNCLEASRLYFTNGSIYDSRGYEFARHPITGTHEDKDWHTGGVFFGAYDDGDGDFFSFCEADCFDPPQYLIRASDFETAYDIFLDEFGTEADKEDYATEEAVSKGIDDGVVTYSGGGKLVHSEDIHGTQLTLLRIEGVTQR